MTGISTLDTFVSGAPFALIDNYSVYRLQVPENRENEPTTSWEQVRDVLVAKAPTSRSNWIVIRYTPVGPQAVDHKCIFDDLHERLAKTDSLLIVADIGDGCSMALIRKQDMKSLPSFDITCMTRELFAFPRGPAQTHKRVVLMVASCCRGSKTSMDIVPTPDGVHSFEQIVAATAALSDSDLRLLRGSILVKPPAMRTPSDLAVLRCLPLLRDVRKDRSAYNGSSVRWFACKPPRPVVPVRMLMNLDQIGTRLREQTNNEFEEFTVGQLLVEPRRRYAVCIMGADSTSGYGKSAYMKRLGLQWSLQMSQILNTPRSSASVIWTNTLEEMNELDIQLGTSICLDEFCLSDRDACQYMSQNMLKVLCDPTGSGNLRARAKNVRLIGDTARLFTTNATSVAEWAGARFKFTAPLLRKSIVFIINRPLVLPGWSERPDFNLP